MNSIYQALLELEQKSQPAALCTVVKTSGSTPRHSTSKMLVYPDGSILGTVGGGELENRVVLEAKLVISNNQARLIEYNMTDPARGDVGICGGQVMVFIEPILPSPLIVIIGGGHVGKAVAHLSKWLGFRVAISDDRPEFCTPLVNPDADFFFQTEMKNLPDQLTITDQTYLILTTRGVSTDIEGLPALLKTRAGFIGIIGSKRRWAETVKQLALKGITREELSRVHSPIGLEINAETPEEIAVSILAEILMLQRKGTGKPMQEQL
jgi:xanthine dehydrogenase accessory factor